MFPHLLTSKTRSHSVRGVFWEPMSDAPAPLNLFAIRRVQGRFWWGQP